MENPTAAPSAFGREESPAAPRERRRTAAARAIGRVDVFDDVALAQSDWAALEAACPGSFYQSRGFLLPWIAAFAKPLGLVPMFVVARDAKDRPAAFLPFVVRRRGLAAVAEFMGDKDSNANMGLFRPDLDFSRDDLDSILRGAAAKARIKPDVFVLANQPARWEGRDNVLAVFRGQGSPSYLHGGNLASGPPSKRLTKDAAKKLKSKRRKLEALGPVEHVVARDAADARRIADAFFEQKLARFHDKGIDSVFDRPEARAFVETASAPVAGEPGAIELHALVAGGRIVATYGGGVHRGRLQLLFNSFDADPEIARSSPGDLLLQSILDQKAAAGLAAFDLGLGESRYKDRWCDETIDMFDSIVPLTAIGWIHATIESRRLGLKRRLKQSAWAWPLVQRLLGRK